MNYRTVSDLDRVIREKLSIIPEDIELIVGIPRSGMLPATLLATYLNLPLTDTMSLLAEESHMASTRVYRIKSNKNSTNIRDYKKILVVDDSCNTGLSISEVREPIMAIAGENTDVLFACVYVSPEAVSKVDIFFEIVPQPRFFEWNIMNHAIIKKTCMDMDGVLCVDPTPEQNDDGERYIDFVLNAKPLWIPKFCVRAIVTSRLEKYRSHTEQWLDKHNVKYQALYMLDLPSKEERIRTSAHAPFKANIYKSIEESQLFIESNPIQAKYIAESTGKAVYCVADNCFYDKETSVQDYLDTKKTVDEYNNYINSILVNIEQIVDGLSLHVESKIDIIEVLLSSWQDIATDLASVYSENSCTDLLDMNLTAKDLAYTRKYSECIDVLRNMVIKCRDILQVEGHKLILSYTSQITDSAWKRELDLIYNILDEKILNDGICDSRYTEEIEYLKNIGRLQMYPYKWTENYNENDVIVYAHSSNMKYVIHNGHKLFLPPYDDSLARHEYNQLIMEQDKESPHKYFDDLCSFDEGDIFVDVGAAEGIISLDVIEKASKIILIECAEKWIKALNRTFEEYKGKVEIVSKYASCRNDMDCVTLDELLSDCVNKNIFIKMDIEGMEIEALQGAKQVLRNNRCHVSCAVYHTQNQENEIKNFFDSVDYYSYPSCGYVLFLYGKMVLDNGKYERIEPPYFRRAIVRAIPKFEEPRL